MDILKLMWKLVKVWGGKAVSFLFKLVKARVMMLVWKYGIMCILIAFTAVLTYIVLS